MKRALFILLLLLLALAVPYTLKAQDQFRVGAPLLINGHSQPANSMKISSKVLPVFPQRSDRP
jgi:hypothetical protein